MNTNNLSILINRNNKNIFDEDFLYYLKAIAKISKKTFIVLSKNIKEEIKESLKDFNIDFLLFDKNCSLYEFYRFAINKIGYKEIQNYDNLILSNNSFYGPIYPLEKMFEQMESETCDYWGFFQKEVSKENFFQPIAPKIDVIDTNFLVFKNCILKSKKFENWWKKSYTFKTEKSYEIKQNAYFEKQKIKASSFIKLDDYKSITGNFDCGIAKIIEDKKLPFITKTSIIGTYSTTIKYCLTHQTNDIIDFIKNNTDYNVELIYQDLIHNKKMSEIKENLHLNYILPTDIIKKEVNKDKKIALIMHIYYEDLVDYCFKYIQSMPDNSNIYIVSSKEETLNKCKEKASSIDNYNFEFRLKANRGRDVSAYLVSCADVFQKHDYICCMHDKKSPYFDSLIAEDFAYQCFECNLSTKDYVANIINTFETNPKIGLLTSPNMYFSTYLEGYSISLNKANILKLLDELEFSIPFDDTPVAPYGSMFWIKKEAMQPLFRHKWEYEDFPTEPLPKDGTISHAVERLYPFVAQEAGFLTGWIIPDKFCAMYLNNLKYKGKIVANEKPSSILKEIFSIENVYLGNEKFKKMTIFNNTFYKGKIVKH
ncbi:MAG: rhamnan synthesis F family protein [bacterium]|nr:rhamnan synthesis F family protein [bacterium]